MRRYGWWALAVYMLASVFDFSLAFASIHLLGADHIRELEEKVREKVGMGKREMEDEEAAVWPVPLGALLGEGGQEGEEQKRTNNAAEAKMALARIRPTSSSSSSSSSSGENEDVAAEAAAAAPTAAASKAKKKMGAGSGTLWTEAVLAYTIHKTLLMPLRLGITAAFTPRFVKWMVKMGWARNNQAVHQAASKAKAARDARKAAASSA
ncbi:hypothetical protein L7F22_048723 [Adiantum nelumboides]|nr:hypothetical protein [Adiantum nelumboides]